MSSGLPLKRMKQTMLSFASRSATSGVFTLQGKRATRLYTLEPRLSSHVRFRQKYEIIIGPSPWRMCRSATVRGCDCERWQN